MAPLATQVGAGAMWGAVFVGGLAEASLGGLRLVGRVRRFFPPVVCGTVIVVIGLALGQVAVRLSIGAGRVIDLAFALGVVATVLTLQLGAREVLGGILARGAIFVSIWVVGLGLGSVAGEVEWSLVASRPWLAWPQLFPYGGPGFGWEFPLAAVLVVLAAYLGSMVESLGDYAATCEVAGVAYRERHMNRGILAEGLGSAFASVLGALPCTSYTQNIGIIATTRVASRFVVQIAAGVLLLYGLCPKFGALLVAMPRPVLGGVFVLICGSIVVAGLRLLGQGADGGLGERQALIAGTTLVLALAAPVVVERVLGPEWLAARPAALSLVLGNSVVLAVLVGVTLQVLLGPDRPLDRRG
ncbi:MAG: xanthine permease [Acidobacteria bacterium]|nr:MAG: xanthine permease [Acidobacteriota bacterium]